MVILFYTFIIIIIERINFGDKAYDFFYKYIKDCYKLKKYKRKNIENEIPFVSICLPTYNMEKYIQRTILSIINQSFQDFEIIVINDFSNDNTYNILKGIQLNNKIKIINHPKNLGLYASRVDGILNAKGKYIILMDPDDMFLNPNLLKELYYNYLKYNLDIIEFTVLRFEEKKKKLYMNEKKYHFHNFSESIIYQPQLQELLFYVPRTKTISSIKCQTIWNKIIKKEVILKTINYIGQEYYKHFIITADDVLMSAIIMQFAKNYSNINYIGYMYNVREISMTHGKKNKKKKLLFNYNYILYIQKLYNYIKDFNKNRNILFFELKRINYYLVKLKNNKIKKEIFILIKN